MSSHFSQIRKDPNLAGVVKELSDRIAAVAPSIDDGDSSIRLLRSETDSIAYTDTDSNVLDGDRTNTDTVDYADNDTNVRNGTVFRVPGGDFLTFHTDTTTLKLRDFIRGSGGFFRSTDERGYAGYSEAS